jgi:hypothetical protein
MNHLTYTDPENATRYVNIVASLSKIGEDPAYLGREMLLSNYSGVVPSLTTLEEVEEELARVEAAASGLAGHPGAYMRALVTSSHAMISILRKEGRPYLDLVRDIIEVDFRPIPEGEAVRLREELSGGLAELGYAGSLRDQVDAWLAATSMTGEAVIEFGKGILERARTDTIEKVTPLPEGEGVDSFTGVRDVFYSGRSAYTGNYRGWLHFNIDKHWQRDVFTQVLCHEAYPGHQTFYTLWDQLFQEGRWPVEAAFYTRNAPTNPIFEGGPEVAMHLVGWDVGDTPEALGLRMGQVYKDLGRIAMNNACLGVNTGAMTKEEAIDLMVDHLVLRDDAERAYGFFTNAVSRTHYPQYYYGRRIVDEALKRMEGDPALRERFIDMLYRTPHTTSTFVDAVSEATGAPFDPFSYRS